MKIAIFNEFWIVLYRRYILEHDIVRLKRAVVFNHYNIKLSAYVVYKLTPGFQIQIIRPLKGKKLAFVIEKAIPNKLKKDSGEVVGVIQC
jgi:hypothetical protein